jgi:hypothetical protein
MENFCDLCEIPVNDCGVLHITKIDSLKWDKRYHTCQHCAYDIYNACGLCLFRDTWQS